MKTTLTSILTGICLCALALIGLPSCTSSSVESALPEITLAAAGGTAFAVQELKISKAEQAYIYEIAVACNSLASGTSAPTVAQLQHAISQYTTTAGAAAIGSLVTSLYSQYYPQLGGNGKTAADLLVAIATGVEDGIGSPTPAAATAFKPYKKIVICYLTAEKVSFEKLCKKGQ